MESHYNMHSSYRDDKTLQAIDSWVRMDLQVFCFGDVGRR